MMRLIDADVLVNQLITEMNADTEKGPRARLAKRIALIFCKVIEVQPTIEPQRTGKWQRVSAGKYINFSDYIYKCDQCEKTSVSQWKYCPNCGMKMTNREEK